MPFPPWNLVPPGTPLRELFGSSLIAHTHEPGGAVLIRCGPGLDKDRAQVVHARARRANALRMDDADADTAIGEQAAALVPGGPVEVVAVPHITWKHPTGGRRWRTPVAALSTGVSVTALLLMQPSVPMAVAVALVVGCLVWLVSRPWTPTHIGPLGAEHSRGMDAVEYAMRRAHHDPATPDLSTPAHNPSPTSKDTGPDIQ